MLKGIMVGFGSVLGATVFLSIFIYLLAQISFVPIVGDFVNDVIRQIGSDTATTENTIELYHETQKEIEENS